MKWMKWIELVKRIKSMKWIKRIELVKRIKSVKWIKQIKLAVLFLLNSLFVLFIVACQADSNQTNIELIQDMMEGPQIKPQEGTDVGEDVVGEDAGKNEDKGRMLNRRLPEKSISREYAPYPFGKLDVESANGLKNPLLTLTKEELLKLSQIGKAKYEIYCGICHGSQGLGDGSIADKMLKRPPNIVDSTYRSYTDGRLFHVVTKGWGLMGGYVSQIPKDLERWAIVDHLRYLQKTKKNPKTQKNKKKKTNPKTKKNPKNKKKKSLKEGR